MARLWEDGYGFAVPVFCVNRVKIPKTTENRLTRTQRKVKIEEYNAFGAKIMFKKMKRMICSILAIVGVTACTATFSACETANPEVEMKISFNGKTYTLNYDLYRKITPTTVNHFLALVENGYYDGLCIHDYSSTSLKTGVYTYENEELKYKDYFTTVEKYIPQSVWLDKDKTRPTYTLYGEFEDNDFSVENGALKEEFGALVMCYESNNDDTQVYIARNSGGVATRAYEYNSATSQFYISLATDTKSVKDKAVFATLDQESKDDLESLQAAIVAFIESEYDDENDFTTDKYGEISDPIDGETEEEYSVPNTPIVIEKITVKKY